MSDEYLPMFGEGIEVLPRSPRSNGDSREENGKERVDTPEGAKSYFKNRFERFRQNRLVCKQKQEAADER